jgi:branched-chain amino acid transport protein azlC
MAISVIKNYNLHLVCFSVRWYSFPVHFILHFVCFGFKKGLMKQKALKAAFPYTLPIFASFWFLALAYGILMNVNGFSFVYPMFEPASLRDSRLVRVLF